MTVFGVSPHSSEISPGKGWDNDPIPLKTAGTLVVTPVCEVLALCLTTGIVLSVPSSTAATYRTKQVSFVDNKNQD